MQINNEFDSTTISESSAPSANGEKCSTTKYFHPYNLRCFLKITPEDVAKMDRFEREVYEKQAENLVAHCDEEIDSIKDREGLMRKTKKDIAALKAGINALDESIAATNAKIEEINALKNECTTERLACVGVQETWDRAQESFCANITRILDKLQREVDAREAVARMKAKREAEREAANSLVCTKQNSRHMQAARAYSVNRQRDRSGSNNSRR